MSYNPEICMYIKEILLNEFSGYFGLSFPTSECLPDDFIKSFPCYNIPKECNIKRKKIQ